MADDRQALDLLAFWWRAGPERWFSVDPAFDDECRERFLGAHEQAAAGALDGWTATPHGTLALLVLLDQIPRNVFRGSARAFVTDGKALGIAETALARGFPDAYPMPARGFFYLPFMHAEDLAAQVRSLDLYRAAGERDTFHYALMHYEAIARFGRFPHRNAVLGRRSTPEEEAFLAGGGFSA